MEQASNRCRGGVSQGADAKGGTAWEKGVFARADALFPPAANAKIFPSVGSRLDAG